MAKYTGKDMFVKFGTLSVGGAGRNLEINQSANEIDVTTYGDGAHVFVAGLIERSATLQILDNDADTAVRAAFTPGSANSLTWFPKGTASGNIKRAVATAVITEANESYPYDDAVLIEVSMRLSGDVQEGTASGAGI